MVPVDRGLRTQWEGCKFLPLVLEACSAVERLGLDKTVYVSVSQPPERCPVPGPGINYPFGPGAGHLQFSTPFM